MTYESKMIAHYAAVRKRLMRVRRNAAEPVAEPEKPARRRRPDKPKPEPMSFADYLRTVNMTAEATALIDYSLCAPFEIQTRLTGDIPKKTTLCIEAEVLARHPGVTSAMLRGPRHFRPLVNARHEVWYCLDIQRPDLPLSVMARLYNRDHSTILQGIRAHKKRNGIS